MVLGEKTSKIILKKYIKKVQIVKLLHKIAHQPFILIDGLFCIIVYEFVIFLYIFFNYIPFSTFSRVRGRGVQKFDRYKY